MLSLLHIENIAVIECADISFDRGFNILTGETGAGKSIVIDAISAIIGERAYRDMIRTGTNKASVRAVFTDVPKFDWFEENGVEYDPETIVQREIYLDGKNVCRVNGTLVTVSILRKLGVQLINIHGQHDSASLFDEENHLVFLDDYAGNAHLRSDYAEKYGTVADLTKQIRQLTMDEGEKLRRMETLRFQIEEISKANLEPGEDDVLEQRRKVLQNAEKLSDGINAAVESLYGSDESDGAASLLAEAEREIARISRFSDSFQALHEKISDLMYQVQDAAEEVRDLRDELCYSADELEQIESRLDVIHRLRRKYGSSCSEILQYLQNAQVELDEIEFSDDHIERLKQKLQKAEKSAWDAALLLRENRKITAIALAEKVLAELSQLDMPKVRFSCEFTETELLPNGADQVAFYMSANVGEALKPMSKVASGGELARIMLAMKNVLAEQDQVATLIFDEVDTGVSGRAAQKVAEKLRSVATSKQVLCVTHLPQLAALANTHLLIAKEERSGRTYTTVTPLDIEGRKRELARIIGGANITQTTLKSAEEMLKSNLYIKREIIVTDVVAALIWDGDRFLACQRPANKSRGLLWEFVGGKVEPGETKEEALIRECKEELGITIQPKLVYTEVDHVYPDITIHLTLFHAVISEGIPQKLEHNDIKWITVDQICSLSFCPADKEILRKMIYDFSATVKRVRNDLISLADSKYAEFQRKLIPDIDATTVLGVRIPALRKYAKSLSIDEIHTFLQSLPHKYYDENILHSILISAINDSTFFGRADDFLKYVDNWAVCDTIAPNAISKKSSVFFDFISQKLNDSHTFTVRFGINMLIKYYLGERFCPSHLHLVSAVRNDSYYINMARAWYFATALDMQYESTCAFLENNSLDRWTHNKTIQKCIDSHRVPREKKEYIRSLRRKST